jgi:MFS family permease
LPSLTWSALSAVLLAMFAITVGYGVVLPILPFLIERLAAAAEPATLSWHTGLLTGTYILAIFLFAPLRGKISDRGGRRPVILLGLGGFAITVALFTVAESLPLLYLGRFLSGLFAAAITPTAYALVGDHAPSKEWRAHRFALINIAGTVGFLVGPLLGGVAVRAAGRSSPKRSQAHFLRPSSLPQLSRFWPPPWSGDSCPSRRSKEKSNRPVPALGHCLRNSSRNWGIRGRTVVARKASPWP